MQVCFHLIIDLNINKILKTEITTVYLPQNILLKEDIEEI